MKKKAIFDNIAFQYDKNRGGAERGQRFANALLPLINTEKKVLDMGVGTGVVASALQTQGCEVIGIDVSSEMLKHAAQSVRTVIWSDMNSLPFLDSYFACVYSVWSLHLVDDLEASLREIRRVLIEGGCLLNCSAANIVTSTPKDEAGKIMADMQIALRGEEVWYDKPCDLKILCDKVDFKFEKVVKLSHTYKTSISQMIKHIENNGMLTLQMATPQQRESIIEPALAALRKLPDSDAPIEREREHQISVLRAF